MGINLHEIYFSVHNQDTNPRVEQYLQELAQGLAEEQRIQLTEKEIEEVDKIRRAETHLQQLLATSENTPNNDVENYVVPNLAGIYKDVTQQKSNSPHLAPLNET